jgi:membrane protease YdiL (CAAX protease family)
VVGRAGLTAAAALAVDAVLWTYLDVLSGLKTTPLYIYMHSGDVLAIALHSAPALILAPVFEELVFR